MIWLADVAANGFLLLGSTIPKRYAFEDHRNLIQLLKIYKKLEIQQAWTFANTPCNQTVKKEKHLLKYTSRTLFITIVECTLFVNSSVYFIIKLFISKIVGLLTNKILCSLERYLLYKEQNKKISKVFFKNQCLSKKGIT